MVVTLSRVLITVGGSVSRVPLLLELTVVELMKASLVLSIVSTNAFA